MAYINQRGLVIIKEVAFDDILREIKNKLRVKPIVYTNYNSPKSFDIFAENDKKLYVPKWFGINEYLKGELPLDKTPEGDEINIKFGGKLRDNQIEPVDITLKAFKNSKKRGGILALAAGFGKTTISLKLISKLKRKTIVLVHKEFLLEQWKSRIQEFLPTARIGRIQGSLFDIKEKDIVIGMLQTISQKDYPLNAFESFGLTIVDECIPYDQCILTENGPRKIGEMVESCFYSRIYNQNHKGDYMVDHSKLRKLERIYCYNEDKRRFELSLIKNISRNKKLDLIIINGFKTTLEHKYLTIKGYIPAQELEIGDYLVSFNSGKVLLDKVENISREKNTMECVYDIEVYNHPNFILINENYPEYGLIVHNCHHTGSEVFSRALFKLGTKYRLGLSATPERQDGLTKVFKWHLGEILYSIEQKAKGLTPKAEVYKFNGKGIGFEKEVLNYSGEKNIPLMITELTRNKLRNNFIISLLCKYLNESKEEKRNILVLSERVGHLENLKELFDSLFNGVYKTALYIGKTKQKEREESLDSDIIFATLSLVSEGFDNPRLNTLIFACINGGPNPNKPGSENQMDQVTGRIFRKEHLILEPKIIDILDQFSLFKNQGTRRVSYYKRKNFDIESFKVTISDENEIKVKKEENKRKKKDEEIKCVF